ncbi:MAG: hypothetical protein JWO50_760 [Candidatus Kaiserbacteria bacterium]|nr:hypothetical protein [Candidatus Kaiserbacteria bacterium]
MQILPKIRSITERLPTPLLLIFILPIFILVLPILFVVQLVWQVFSITAPKDGTFWQKYAKPSLSALVVAIVVIGFMSLSVIFNNN